MTDRNRKQLAELAAILRRQRKTGRRDMPWRAAAGDSGPLDPYRVLVSELMLQQTQVSRVMRKYSAFLARFPDVSVLAAASISDLLQEWQGMGYNRRALFLKRAAEEISMRRAGKFPAAIAELIELPGIGLATAGAIAVYSHNRPEIFIETNVRRVFLYHFFPRSQKVPDKKLIPFIEAALDRENPREWYYAVMDYGSQLAAREKVANPNRRSRHYAKQSKFEGSNRQIRGAILKILVREGGLSRRALEKKAGPNDPRTTANIEKLIAEGFLRQEGSMILLA